MALIDKLKEEQKLAMKAKDKPRLGTIRLALSAIKQREVDEQITLNDDDILAVLVKMVKQRRDSVAQYESAGRQDLADVEQAEIAVLEEKNNNVVKRANDAFVAGDLLVHEALVLLSQKIKRESAILGAYFIMPEALFKEE